MNCCSSVWKTPLLIEGLAELLLVSMSRTYMQYIVTSVDSGYIRCQVMSVMATLMLLCVSSDTNLTQITSHFSPVIHTEVS